MLSRPARRHTLPVIRRTSLNLNLDLLEQARQELGTRGTTETIHRALDEVVRRAALERLSKWRPFDGPPPDGFADWNDWIEDEERSQ
jgi:hypothetical protein